MRKLTTEQEAYVVNNFYSLMAWLKNKIDPMQYILIEQSFLGGAFERGYSFDLLDEIYAFTGVYNFMENIYDINIEEMKYYYDINADLLEVGCGMLPALATRLSKLQTSGSIDAYDPLVVASSFGRVRIFKKNITEKHNVSKYKLIYGIKPCEATIPMIRIANKYDKDLYINLCNCAPKDEKETIPYSFSLDSSSKWLKIIEEEMEETLPKGRKYEIIHHKKLKNPIVRTYK